MRRRLALSGSVVVLAALVGLLVQPTASAEVAVHKAVLTGENEVNSAGDPNQGDLDGLGKAKIRVNVAKDLVCFKLRWEGITSPDRAHIHDGPAGVNGPIVVTLFEGLVPSTINKVRGCTELADTPENEALLRDIKENPGEYYVNLHNADFPGGALRGQLS